MALTLMDPGLRQGEGASGAPSGGELGNLFSDPLAGLLSRVLTLYLQTAGTLSF